MIKAITKKTAEQVARAIGRRNDYPAKCCKCGKTVDAGAGHITGFVSERGAWLIEHGFILSGGCGTEVK